jgi:hypothetical protein
MSEYASSEKPTGVLASIQGKRDEKSTIRWCEDQYKRARDSRITVERQWQLNLAFYAGKQNCVITNTTGTTSGFVLRVPEAPPWRVRMVINRIRPIIRTLIAKLTANKPIFTVVPLSSEDRDIVAARVAELIFAAQWSCKNIQKVLRQAVWWSANTGTGFIKCYWDPEAIDKDSNQKGEICYERVDPYHIFVPHLEQEDIEYQPFVLHVMTKSLEWAKANYGDVGGKLVASTDNPLDDAFMTVLDVQKPKCEEVLCLEYWIKPGNYSEYPNGAYLLLVGDKLVANVKEFPYDHGCYPFAKLDDIPTGRFYCESVTTDLIGLQREVNRTRSQIIEAKNRMSKPQLLAAKGSIDPRRITSEPGQVIEYIPGFPQPSPLPLQSIPPYVNDVVDRLYQDMDDISGQHQISRGSTPPQVTAATAISFLQEQDDSALAYSLASIEDAIVKIGRLTLGYVSQFWDTPRLVRVVGSDGAFEAQYYKAKDLGNTYDVRVEAGSTMQLSKAAKQAFLMDAMKNGLLPNDIGMEMLGIGGLERVYESIMMDRRQAERENLKLSVGLEISANDWDNHQFHVDVHNRFRKSQEFEMLPPEIQNMYDVHVNQHQLYAMNAMQSQLGSGMVLPGQPPPSLTQDAGAAPPDQPGPPPGPSGPDQQAPPTDAGS